MRDLLAIVRMGRHMRKGAATNIKIHVHLFVGRKKTKTKNKGVLISTKIKLPLANLFRRNNSEKDSNVPNVPSPEKPKPPAKR
jgi:hypothetical protein